MRGGKSELAKICEKYGYERISFALPLKNLCADLLDMSIDELNKYKNQGIEIGINLQKDHVKIISEETNIPFDIVETICNEKKYISTVRDLLQFVGTDIIRKYNQNWHVNKIREMLNPKKSYVFDDVRFQNEKALIEDLGGDVWFVTRKKIDEVSNHESETSIFWKHCWNKIIINDSTLQQLLFKWEIFMDNYNDSCAARDKEFDRILEVGLEDININKNTDVSPLDILLLPKDLFTYVPQEYNKEDIQNVEMKENKDVFITYKDGSVEIIQNTLNIEDLKIIL